jgi:hypothetical protein
MSNKTIPDFVGKLREVSAENQKLRLLIKPFYFFKQVK